MSKFLLAGACAVALLSTAAIAHADTATDAKFKALYSREWSWRSAQFDMEEDSKTVPDHLPKVDPATQAQRLAYWSDVMEELDAIPLNSLSPENQVNYAVYKAQIGGLLNEEKFREYEKPLNADTTFWTELSGEARRHLETEQDYRNYIAWLRDFPRYFHDQEANMRAGLKRRFTPPKATLTGRDASISMVSEGKTPQDNLFYEPFKKMPATIPADVQAKLRADAAAAIQQAVVPTYAELLSFMRDDYVPNAQTSLAAEDLPDGKAYYQSKIKEFTTTDLTPDQIHEIGLKEVAKIHAEMLDAMKETGFTGDFPAFLHYLRTDPKFYAKTPQELLNDAAWIAKEFDGKASQYFGYMPRGRFAIKPVPADIAPFYTAGRGGQSVYLLNTYDLPSRPLYNLTALTLHESAPGHAWQGAIAVEHKDQPEFRQKVYISAYGEGWALYCEKLGVEMGMYQTPYDRFGMLGYQMWRAARLVVDTGVHAKGWTREQAQKYFHDNTALPDHEIETEVDRYISWPGQALSYYLGEMTIVNARARAEKALGPKFNIRAFHDTILELGSVPLPVIDARIDRFIAEGGVGPYPEMEK